MWRQKLRSQTPNICAASACVSRPAFHPSYASSNLIFRISCSSFVGFISPSSGNRTTGQIACYKTGQIKSSRQSEVCGLMCHIIYGMMHHMKAQRIFYQKEMMLGGVIEMVIWQLPEATCGWRH